MSIKPKKVTASTFKKLAKCVRFKFPDGRVIHSHKSLAIEGAPGMGKTCLIQSVAEDWELPCITVAINQWSNAADIVGFISEFGVNLPSDMATITSSALLDQFGGHSGNVEANQIDEYFKGLLK